MHHDGLRVVPTRQSSDVCFPPLCQAKERSIESLRDTLATTKRSYEGRIAQVEAALTLRSAEVRVQG